MLALVRTPSGATCNGVLQLEATFIDVKNYHIDYSGIHSPCPGVFLAQQT